MERLFAKLKKETLSKDEKIKILSVLRDFVAENPAKAIKSPFYSEWFVFKYRITLAPAALVLVFALTGGTVFASLSSLPGDMLYPVKMIKEKVESATASSPKAQAQVEVSHAITRLQEVEQMVTLNKPIEKGTGKEISDNFGAQVQDATNKINELKNSGQSEDAMKIQSDFNKSLSEHEQTIQKILTGTSTQDQTKEELSRVYSDVHSQLKKSDRENQDQGEVRGARTETKQKKNSEKNNYSESENNNN